MKKTIGFILVILVLLSVFHNVALPQSYSQQTPNVTPTERLVPPSVPTTGVDLALSPTFLSVISDPGESVNTQFKVRNNNNFTEYLQLKVAKFTASADGSSPVIADMEDSDEWADWLSFSEEQFTVASGETKIITVSANPPADAALGYYYAILVSRITDAEEANSQAVVSGSPAIPLLLNVKSPNAKRELQLVSFKTDKMFYEYLPTQFKVEVKNSGNIHAVPVGDIFLDGLGGKRLSVLQMNEGKGNILPNTTRVFDTSWTDGFAVRVPKEENGEVVRDKDGKVQYTTEYDFTKADKFRIGKYTANLLMVYDNGERDIPIEATVSFWVIPWKGLLIVGVILILAFVGLKSAVTSNFKRLSRIFHG